jgi:hypothetical protein
MPAGKERILLSVVVCLFMVANGVSFLSAAILFVMLTFVASFFMWTKPITTVGLLTIKVSLTLAILAFGWVMIASYDPWWRWALVLPLLTFGLWAISNFSELPKASGEPENANYLLLLLSASALVLVVRSWIHFIPLFIALGIWFALVRLPQAHRYPVLMSAIGITITSFGALWSRLILSGAEIRVWMTYDQQFRASLATSLTRWGWTDWNSAPGQEIRYHWLSEGTAGFIARVAMLDEFDAITRVMPVLGITAIVFVSVHLFRELGVSATIATVITVPVVGFHSALEVFSIGTLWGGLWILVATYLLYTSWTSINSRSHQLTREWVMILTIGVALLTQSTAGVTLGIVTGFVYLLQFVNGRRRLINVVTVGLALLILVLVASQTILQSRAGTAYGADLRNFLKEGWRFFPADIALILLLGFMLYSRRIEIRDLFLPGVYAITAMMIANIVRIGGHEGRLLSEAQLVVTVLGLGAITRCIVTRKVRNQGRYSTLRGFKATYVALAVTVLMSYMAYSYSDDARRNWEFSTRSVFPLEQVHGDINVNACLDWIRNNTPPSTLVASNMWRTPGSEDQKYFLVSLKTKRQVLVDGPTYVANTGTYDDPSILESHKNLIDYFVWSPTVARMEALEDLGVDILLTDDTRKHSTQIGNFVATKLSNPRCSVFAL